MFPRWLTLTACLCAAEGRGSVTVAPTCRVKGHPEAELTMNCGDGKKAGVVQYWHTPFGDLQTPGSHLDPVFMHHDGSLKVPKTSILHGGLYYCLLQHAEGTALWPYQLHVGQHSDEEEEQEHSGGEERDVFRFRRDVGSLEKTQAGVSDTHFAGAVVASVLLTFVVGFSAGALTRTPVLRCLGTLTTRFQQLQQQQQQQQRTTHSEVTMATLPPMHDNQAWDSDTDSAHCSTMETTISPPTKPQRSFREKRQEQETTAYLEGCDNLTEEHEEEVEQQEKQEEEEEGKGLKGNNEACDGKAMKEQFSQTQTDEDLCSKDEEEKDRGEGREEKTEVRQEEEEEEEKEEEQVEDEDDEACTEKNSSNEDGEERRESEEEGRSRDEDNEQTDSDDETGSNRGAGRGGGGGTETLPSAGRRSRVIRLYQYDEDGQRFGHLPHSATEEPGPPPRLKQRSLSLTRLNTIMAAASAGPLDPREPGKGEGEERPHFHMEI